ncbi:MAG: threonine ammonia-lyase [Oscillospiraceae bacterium]|nr:threonine ammonia-lyase [Oscillospiraceae bacterium]
MLTIDAIRQAQANMKDVVRKTDLTPAFDLDPENQVYLKEENLQLTGSFKIRGAFNKISMLSDEEKARGVIACSAGNHAQGVALAATKRQIQSTICIPSCAPISKIEKTKRYGGEVCLVDGVYDDAYEKACEIQKQSGAVFIHPFNDDDVIAGQGTIGLEILEQLPQTDAVVVPVGGGGLISGVAFAVKELNPACKVYGVQASGAAGMVHALQHGGPQALDRVSTFADGIAVKCPGSLTYQYCKEYVDDIVTVTDDEIATAVLQLIEQDKVIAEGAGAAAVAAVMYHKIHTRGKNIVCVVSGGNIDVTILSRVIKRGLLKQGRIGRIQVDIVDKPGQIMDISTIIAQFGGNILSIYHDRNAAASGIDYCFLSFYIETRNMTHYEEICDAISNAGYHIVSK